MIPKALKQHTRDYYSRLFQSGRAAPAALPIQTGKALALELGYPIESLELIPDRLWDLFAPCGYPLEHLEIGPGRRILNLGCGAGVDSFLLAAHCPGIQVVGLDLVWDVLDLAHRWSAMASSLSKGIGWVCGDGEGLPFQDGCFDAVILNGVFNLCPDKPRLLSDIRRVLRPGSRLIIADLAATAPLPEYFADEPDAWAWCMSGALTSAQLEYLLQQAGFDSIVVTQEEGADMFMRVLISCGYAAPDCCSDGRSGGPCSEWSRL